MSADFLPFPPAKRKRRTASRVITIEVGRRSAWLRGTGLAKILEEVDCPRMWCWREKCLTVPVDRVDDILALVEHRDRRVVNLTAVDR
ncbi:MAG: hypothetical protein M3Q22_10840 [Actinomycetota bacterium]|nr:hypothetical protein [Actinomycetota bacterium]